VLTFFGPLWRKLSHQGPTVARRMGRFIGASDHSGSMSDGGAPPLRLECVDQRSARQGGQATTEHEAAVALKPVIQARLSCWAASRSSSSTSLTRAVLPHQGLDMMGGACKASSENILGRFFRDPSQRTDLRVTQLSPRHGGGNLGNVGRACATRTFSRAAPKPLRI